MKLGRSADPAPGRFRRALHRLAADDAELLAEELQSEAEAAGGTPVERCPLRAPVCIAGTIRAVTLRPRGGAPALEAELYDGTGSVALVWLGRRRIAGIEPGRAIVAHGRIALLGDQHVMFNPRYELKMSGVSGRAS